MGRRRMTFIDVVHGTIFCEQFGRAISHIMRMRKAEIDQEWLGVLSLLSLPQVFHHTIAMPAAASFMGATPLGRIMADGEEPISSFITISLFARAHRRITGAV